MEEKKVIKHGKGHPNYYEGKKIKYSKFIEVWDRYAPGEISLRKAAEELGVCHETFRKWRDQIVKNGSFDERLTFMIWE